MPNVITGGNAWPSTRLEALRRLGAITDKDVALSVLAQWAFETDSGRAEHNFNVGNVKAVGTEPRVQLGAAGAFRAYASLDEGVAAYLNLVQSPRYAACWALLEANPTSTDWVTCIGRSGYYEASPVTYAAGWQARRAQLAKLV